MFVCSKAIVWKLYSRPLALKFLLVLGFSAFTGLAFSWDKSPPIKSSTWDIALEELRGRKFTDKDLEDFFYRLKIDYGRLKSLLSGGDEVNEGWSGDLLENLKFIQVYDRPNDDPHQNEKVREDLGLSVEDGIGYSTARIALAMSFVPVASDQVKLYLFWAAQMSVGTHTESARYCHLEFGAQKYPLEIVYPSPEISLSSPTFMKKSTFILAPPLEAATLTYDESKILSGRFSIKRGSHTHYHIDYKLEISDGRVKEVFLNSSNFKPVFADTDIYLVGSKTPFTEDFRESIFFERTTEEVQAVEIVGGGAAEVGRIFRKNNCLSCHSSDGRGGEYFDEDTGVPLDFRSLGEHLAPLLTEESIEALKMKIQNYPDKWPKKMKLRLLIMLSNESDRRLLRKWFQVNESSTTEVLGTEVKN